MQSAGIVIALVVAAAQPQPTHNPRCGSNCLYVSLKAMDRSVGSLKELEDRLGPPSPAGYSIGQLQQVAESYGAHTIAVQTSFENLQRRPERFACIAHLNGSHFVNFAAIGDNQVQVIDPPRRYTVPIDTLRTQWDGTALLISDQPLTPEEKLPRDFPWATILLMVSGAAAIATVWVLSRRRRRSR